MRKDTPMSKEIINRRLQEKLEAGEKMCALKIIRMSRGLSQAQLAERAGLVQAQIGRIESGERDIGNMSMRNGYSIANVLGCRMEDLMR